jgi:hypothetical protein
VDLSLPSNWCFCLRAYCVFLCWSSESLYVHVECFSDCILSVLCLCVLVYPRTVSLS